MFPVCYGIFGGVKSGIRRPTLERFDRFRRTRDGLLPLFTTGLMFTPKPSVLLSPTLIIIAPPRLVLFLRGGHHVAQPPRRPSRALYVSTEGIKLHISIELGAINSPRYWWFFAWTQRRQSSRPKLFAWNWNLQELFVAAVHPSRGFDELPTPGEVAMATCTFSI
jgi:hypothetical protein